MARRKSIKGYKRVNCYIHPNCYVQLNGLAGEDGMGDAIEQLCERETLLVAILDSQLPAEQRAAAARELLIGKKLLKSSA